MSPIATSMIVFACVFGGALFGMLLHSVLLQNHLSAETKSIVNLGTGIIGTMAALVLGLPSLRSQYRFWVPEDVSLYFVASNKRLKRCLERHILGLRGLRHRTRPRSVRSMLARCISFQCWVSAFACVFLGLPCLAEGDKQNTQTQKPDEQINVNWLYGSYVPKDVPLEPLNGRMRFKLYVRQTFTTPGIYFKTTFFALHDQARDTYPQWGDGFGGFAKRLGNRHAQFIIQNSVASVGNSILRWEPRYDRCRCDGFWPRTGHAVARNFVTYDRTEKSLRPQIMPYLGAFAGSAISTTWQPGNPSWSTKGYQGAITQIFVGIGINWIGEFAPEIMRVLHRKKKTSNEVDTQQR
jgi:hypothetical protein